MFVHQANKEVRMNTPRFDVIVQTLFAARSRRQAMHLLGASLIGLLPVLAMEAGGPDVSAASCRVGGARCKNNAHCCSKRCKRQRGKKNGKCTSLGEFAANCPRVDICATFAASPRRCHLGEVEGYCTPMASGAPFCSYSAFCGLTTPICETDDDCAQAPGGGAKYQCLPCSGAGCPGNVWCAVYVGDTG